MDELRGKEVLYAGKRKEDDEEKGNIITWTGTRWANITLESGEHRRLPPELALQYHFKALKKSSDTKGTPLAVKRLASELLKRMQDHKSLCSQKSDIVKKEKQKQATYNRTINKEHGLQAQLGEVLNSCKDTHTISSLEKKVETSIERMQEAASALQELKAQEKTVFSTIDEILLFFKTMGVDFSQSSLSKWARGEGLGKLGRGTAIDLDAEKQLMDVILFRDAMGMPMDQKAIRAQAYEWVIDPTIKARFSTNGPTKKWFKAFLARARSRDPTITTAITRGTECRTLNWFNSNNINWWFDVFKTKIIELGFAREPTDEEANCDAVWFDEALHRVLISDETCVSGGNTRKAQKTRSKVVTVKQRLEETDKGGKQRRTASSAVSTEEHITLLASVTLSGHVGPPVWILSAKNDIRKESRAKIESITSKCGGTRDWDLTRFNNRIIEEAFITTSESGGITKKNVTETMTKLFRAMYPDVENKRGKRVLWMTDWHDSRLSFEFIDAMRNMGVVMIGWLPNITSKAQLPDVAIFGAFKSKRDNLEAMEVMKNPGVRIDRHKKIELACKAMSVTFNPNRIMKGARLTGMVPIDRKALLAHPNIHDGNTLYEASRSKLATSVLSSVQGLSRSGTSNSPSSFNAELLSTPQRSACAESTYTSISQQAPRLGPRRLFAASTPDQATFESERKRVRDQLETTLFNVSTDMPKYVAAKEQSTHAQKQELDRQKQELDKSLVVTINALKQEVEQLKVFLARVNNNDPVITPNCLALVDERVEDICLAERDQFGMPLDDRPVANISDVLVTDLHGFDKSVLEKSIETAQSAVAARASVGNKRKRTVQNKTPFRIGNIMRETGEIEGTSDAIFHLARDHETQKAEIEAAAEANATIKKQKLATTLATLPQDLEQARAKIKVGQDGVLVQASIGDCRQYLKLLLKNEKLVSGPNSDRYKVLLGISKLKGNELVEKVVALAHPPSS